VLQKKGEPKNEGKSAEVGENKCRKNVTLSFCAEVIGNKVLIVFLRICDEK
jgi:hypothetical protein